MELKDIMTMQEVQEMKQQLEQNVAAGNSAQTTNSRL